MWTRISDKDYVCVSNQVRLFYEAIVEEFINHTVQHLLGIFKKLYGHFEEAVYFLPLSSQIFLISMTGNLIFGQR